MKNNRQVGLDGKIYLTSCLKRGTIYIFGLLFYGIINAFADILKLTGRSGYKMSTLTTTLISFDLLLSLLLIVVVFYAYFLECGSAVPVLKDKPIIIMGYCRMGYNVLLCYYIVFRAMYCIANRDIVPFGTLLFYICYMVVTFLSILACCFVLNILQRNMIRRVFIRSFRTLAICGIVFSSLVPITYIIARFFMKEIGDEYFTAALCDMLRLCIAPLFYICLWVAFLRARTVTAEVFGEVDSAIRDRRYQITYKENVEQLELPKENKKLLSKRAQAAAAAATVAAIEASKEKPAASVPALPQNAPVKTEEKKDNAPIGPVQQVTEHQVQQKIKDEKLREAVSQAVAKVMNEEAAAANAQAPAQPANTQKAPAAPNQPLVTDFDPFAQADKAKPPVKNPPVQPAQQRPQPQRQNPNMPAQGRVQPNPGQRPNPQMRNVPNQGRPVQRVAPVKQPGNQPMQGNRNINQNGRPGNRNGSGR